MLGSRCSARATLVRLAKARRVTCPGCSFTQSTLNWAALLPQGDPLGRASPVLPRPAAGEALREEHHYVLCSLPLAVLRTVGTVHIVSKALVSATTQRAYCSLFKHKVETVRIDASREPVISRQKSQSLARCTRTRLCYRHIRPARHFAEV